ncbi:hypothetical protein SNEBB_006100 [Seison nebaliae]|nr:hypothetical protein SNEBB_006100 [Seison nebaliae]
MVNEQMMKCMRCNKQNIILQIGDEEACVICSNEMCFNQHQEMMKISRTLNDLTTEMLLGRVDHNLLAFDNDRYEIDDVNERSFPSDFDVVDSLDYLDGKQKSQNFIINNQEFFATEPEDENALIHSIDLNHPLNSNNFDQALTFESSFELSSFDNDSLSSSKLNNLCTATTTASNNHSSDLDYESFVNFSKTSKLPITTTSQDNILPLIMKHSDEDKFQFPKTTTTSRILSKNKRETNMSIKDFSKIELIQSDPSTKSSSEIDLSNVTSFKPFIRNQFPSPNSVGTSVHSNSESDSFSSTDKSIPKSSLCLRKLLNVKKESRKRRNSVTSDTSSKKKKLKLLLDTPWMEAKDVVGKLLLKNEESKEVSLKSVLSVQRTVQCATCNTKKTTEADNVGYIRVKSHCRIIRPNQIIYTKRCSKCKKNEGVERIRISLKQILKGDFVIVLFDQFNETWIRQFSSGGLTPKMLCCESNGKVEKFLKDRFFF